MLVLFVLDVAPGEVATFKLTGPRDAIQIPNLVVPGGFNTVVAALLAFLGARQFLRGGGRWATLFIGIGLGIAVLAFLVWADAGKSFNLTGMLQRDHGARGADRAGRACGRAVASGSRWSTSPSRGCCWPAPSPAR